MKWMLSSLLWIENEDYWNPKINVHRWELLRVVWVDVVLAAHCHRQGDVPAVGINIHLPSSLSLIWHSISCKLFFKPWGALHFHTGFPGCWVKALRIYQIGSQHIIQRESKQLCNTNHLTSTIIENTISWPHWQSQCWDLNTIAGPSRLTDTLVMLVVGPKLDVKFAIRLNIIRWLKEMMITRLVWWFYLAVAALYPETVSRGGRAVGCVLWIPKRW